MVKVTGKEYHSAVNEIDKILSKFSAFEICAILETLKFGVYVRKIERINKNG